LSEHLLRGAAGTCGNVPHPRHLISLYLNGDPATGLPGSRASANGGAEV
jgi:hypothetical protein